MIHESPYWWIVRVSWPLLGGAWGVWLVFGGYLRLPHNADSFAMVFVLGGYSVFALIGLFIGIATGALIGGSVEKLLRLLGAGTVTAMSVATLVNALLVWQLVGFVQAQYPGLRSEEITKSPQRNTRPPVADLPASSNNKFAPQQSCASPPPEDPRQRAIWNSECR